MRICICDDDSAVHAQLRRLLDTGVLQSVSAVTSLYTGEELAEAYRTDKPFDLVFLDVEMGAFSGIEAAKFVRQADPDVMIVFVSSHRRYVFDAFPVGALHYLLKPVQPEDFAAVCRRAETRFLDLHAVIRLRYKENRFTVPVRQILYVEGARRHVYFHTTDGVLETVGKLGDYAPILVQSGFAAPHASFLVNMDRIERIEQDRIVLENGETVFCSVRKRRELLRAYDHYLGNRKW